VKNSFLSPELILCEDELTSSKRCDFFFCCCSVTPQQL